MKLRLLAFVLVLCVWCFSFVVHSQDKGELYIVTEDYPPYEMKTPINGQRGFDFEIAKLVFETLGYIPKIDFLPWKRALSSARRGATIGILTCAFREERTSFILYSDPISQFTNGFYTRTNFAGPTIKTLEDVRGFRSASVGSYESFKALEELGLQPSSVENVPNALRMLNGDRFDYLYLAKQATDYQIRNLGLAGKFRFYPISRQEFHFCFSRKYPGVEAIAKEFARVLAKLKANGDYERIHSRYK